MVIGLPFVGWLDCVLLAVENERGVSPLNADLNGLFELFLYWHGLPFVGWLVGCFDDGKNAAEGFDYNGGFLHW